MTHAPNVRYCLPTPYRRRPKPEYFVDALDSVIWQPDVYPAAAAVARKVGARTIIDVGSGSGEKLVELHPEFQIVGIDFGENLAACRRRHPYGFWVEHDLEAFELPRLPAGTAAGAVVVCADVIEHLVAPERLLTTLRDLLVDAAAVVISTPERELTRGAGHPGPPDNPCHTMEWALREFEDLMAAHGLVHGVSGLTRSNDVENAWKTIVGVYFRDAETRARGEVGWGWERVTETGSPVLPAGPAERQLALYESAALARAQRAAVEQERALRVAGRRRERADAPVDVELEARGRVTVATAEELLRHPRLLRAYAADTPLEDDATLVVLTPGVPEDVAGPLQQALENADWADAGPDVLLHGPSRDGGAALAARAAAVLGSGAGLRPRGPAAIRDGLRVSGAS